jgi:hypothetical protein
MKDYMFIYAKQSFPGETKKIINEDELGNLQKLTQSGYDAIIKNSKNKAMENEYVPFYDKLYKERKDFIDNILKRESTKVAVVNKTPQKDNTISKRSFEGMSATILTDKEELTKEEKELIKKLKKEAYEEFLKMKDIVVAGKFDDMKGRLLDNCKVLPKDKIERTYEGFKKGMELEQKILKRIKKVSAYSYRVGLSENDEPVVSFKLRNTKDISRLDIKRYSSNLTIDKKGTFIVIMKKIGKTWYWNPFGW